MWKQHASSQPRLITVNSRHMQPSYTISLLHSNAFKTLLLVGVIEAFISNLSQTLRKKSLAQAVMYTTSCYRYITAWSFHPKILIQLMCMNLVQSGLKEVKPPFLSLEKMIPIMPFHTILLDNFRCIPVLTGQGPNPLTQSKMLNMMCHRLCPDVGLLQLCTCCQYKPAGRLHCLTNTHHFPPKKCLTALLLTSASSLNQTFEGPHESCSAPPTRRHSAWAGAPAQSHIHCWQVRHRSSSSSPSPVAGSDQKTSVEGVSDYCSLIGHPFLKMRCSHEDSSSCILWLYPMCDMTANDEQLCFVFVFLPWTHC